MGIKGISHPCCVTCLSMTSHTKNLRLIANIWQNKDAVLVVECSTTILRYALENDSPQLTTLSMKKFNQCRYLEPFAAVLHSAYCIRPCHSTHADTDTKAAWPGPPPRTIPYEDYLCLHVAGMVHSTFYLYSCNLTGFVDDFPHWHQRSLHLLSFLSLPCIP